MGEKIRGKEEYFILPENVLGILLSFGKFRDEGELSKWKICRILERQLRELSCEDGRCFDVVKIRKFGAGRFRLYVKYGPAVHRE
ncbi:hypothetical protein [Blautia hydrogenotrophica]|uniref:hypothetical protein n=1 Tax=Blautia hydrogenotrophica TaxID=53443 RepID=UPI003AEFDDBF